MQQRHKRNLDRKPQPIVGPAVVLCQGDVVGRHRLTPLGTVNLLGLGQNDADRVAGHCVKKTRERHAVRELKEDPSEPSCRGRLQTATSCFGQCRGGERRG